MDKNAVTDKRIRVVDTKPHPRNYNRHDEAQVEDLRESLRQFGQVRSVVVQASKRNGSYLTVAGHGIVEAARLEGITHLRANVIPASWSSARVLAYLAADNELARRGSPDELQLARLVAEIQEREGDVLARLAAGEKKALDRLLTLARNGDGSMDAEPQIDWAMELQKEWGTARGQLWELPARSGKGVHRLLCGDSTVREDVERVMWKEKAEMVFADPPYGVAVGDKNKFLNSIAPSNRVEENLENDTLDESALVAMLAAAFDNVIASCLAGAAWYVAAPAGPPHILFGQILKDRGIWRQTIQWVKNNATFSPMGVDYHWRAEPIFYGWLPNAGHRYYGGRRQDTIWEIDRPMKSPEHPTMKPVELVERAVNNSSLPGEVVCDQFVGSGTTLIACENLGRLCRAIEIAPQYVAVSLQRYLDAFGIEPRLIESGNGKTKAKREVASQQATPATR